MCSITIYNSEMLSLIAVLLLTFLVFLSLNSFQAGQILGKTWCSKYLKSSYTIFEYISSYVCEIIAKIFAIIWGLCILKTARSNYNFDFIVWF